MFNRNGFKEYQVMNLICKSDLGAELWLGDYYAATDHDLLTKKNISGVLTAAAHLQISYPSQLAIDHKILHAYDLPTYKMAQHFQQAYQFINKCLENGKNVLVHCAAGISRSTTCVLVYLMRKKQFTFKQGLLYVRKRRPIVNPNYGFENQLLRFEERLRKRIKSRSYSEKTNEKDAVRAFLSKQKDQQNKKISKMFESNNNYNYKLGKTFGESKGNKMPMINNKLYSTNGELQKITVPKIVTIKR